MFDQLTRAPRRVVRSAEAAAHAMGAHAIEAEHLLVALAEPSAATGAVLRQLGLDDDRVRELIRLERARSLAAAGVTAEMPSPSTGSLGLSTSAKAVLRRAVAAGHGAVTEPALLVAVAEQETGTVPRLLSLAGVDRAQLRTAAAAAEQP